LGEGFNIGNLRDQVNPSWPAFSPEVRRLEITGRRQRKAIDRVAVNPLPDDGGRPVVAKDAKPTASADS